MTSQPTRTLWLNLCKLTRGEVSRVDYVKGVSVSWRNSSPCLVPHSELCAEALDILAQLKRIAEKVAGDSVYGLNFDLVKWQGTFAHTYSARESDEVRSVFSRGHFTRDGYVNVAFGRIVVVDGY